jgi:hypothetical protein
MWYPFLIFIGGSQLRVALCLFGRHFTTWIMPSPSHPLFFALVIFQIGSSIFAQDWPQTAILLTIPPIARTTDAKHYAQLVGWDGVSLIFLPRLAFNCNPPNLHLLSSWDYTRATMSGLDYRDFCRWTECVLHCKIDRSLLETRGEYYGLDMKRSPKRFMCWMLGP